MRLGTFEVLRYRGIDRARLELGAVTVLVGPNNEGKSTILRAVALAMAIIGSVEFNERKGERRKVVFGDLAGFGESDGLDFDWSRDYPVALQGEPAGATEFRLEIELTQSECDQFESEVGSKLDVRSDGGKLPLELRLVKGGFAELRVTKTGRGAAVVTKIKPLAAFLRRRIDVQYIGAVRTAESALSVVESLIAQQLHEVEQSPEFKAALEALKAAHRPVLAKISEDIRTALVPFVPALRGVRVSVQPGSAGVGSAGLKRWRCR